MYKKNFIIHFIFIPSLEILSRVFIFIQMKELSITNTYLELDSINELNQIDQDLLQKAIESSKKAYAPYSKFHVGAAILLENGEIVTGNNQENAAYPSGLCAERVAAFHASSQFPEVKFITIAITANSKEFNICAPIYPCGACRQVLAEYEYHFEKDIKLILMGETGKVHIVNNVKTFLPLMFTPKDLIK
jgi:cytidine deaminase